MNVLEKFAAAKVGDRVVVLPAKSGYAADDVFNGPMYVVGKLAPCDLKLARRAGDDWEVIVHCQRIEVAS